METYIIYKGYGITYSTFMGDTVVDSFGNDIKTFYGHGEAKGRELAKKYIDGL